MGEWREKFDNWVKSFSERKRVISTGRTLMVSAAVVVGAIAIHTILYPYEWAGFRPDSNKSVTTKQVINPKNGEIITLIETTEHFQSSKTLWDWLGLLGTLAVPVLLATLGNQFQRREREIADINLRDEALQVYIDRLSELLLDEKHRLELLFNKQDSDSSKLLLKKHSNLEDNSVRDIARIRTLAILRRLEGDVERQARVLYFLRDAQLLEFLLKKANFSGADLSGAHLRDAHLSRSYFRGTNLRRTNLSRTNLSGADFSRADLSGADLSGADLSGANLSGAKLEKTILNEETILPDGSKYQLSDQLVKFTRANASQLS